MKNLWKYTWFEVVLFVLTLLLFIFTIGAEKLKTDLDVLKKAYNSIRQGARGIIFGRNIFMADNPKKLIKALNDVMNRGVKPEEALKKD